MVKSVWYDMNFSLRIKELREQRGLSQAKLARELGVGVGSVGMWESTPEIPPVKKLIRIADYFGVTLDDLIGRSEGRDGARLSAEDREVLRAYHALNAPQRELLQHLVESWKQ